MQYVDNGSIGSVARDQNFGVALRVQLFIPRTESYGTGWGGPPFVLGSEASTEDLSMLTRGGQKGKKKGERMIDAH
jgi:hypothetical protein